MATEESSILNRVMLQWSKLGGRIFRNNRGVAWVGQAIRLENGDVLLKNPRTIRYGVGLNGGSDLIGWYPFKDKAIFSAIEVKTLTGIVEPDQINFIDKVNSAGGIAFVARTPLDVIEKIEKFRVEMGKIEE